MEKRDEDRKWMSSGDGGQDAYRSEAGRNGGKTIVIKEIPRVPARAGRGHTWVFSI